MTPINRTTVRIPTPSGFDIEAWFYLPEGQGPFPAVVMGHGLGAVKVGGLASFAERFCREGFAAVVIDYRQWGGSEGQQPRDELNVPRQREDYSAAIGWAAAQPNIDEHRIFVWGTSFAGMHATALAASDHRLAGAIAQCPLVDGLAGSRLVRPTHSLPIRHRDYRSPRVARRPRADLSAGQRGARRMGHRRHIRCAVRQEGHAPARTGRLAQPDGGTVTAEHPRPPPGPPRARHQYPDPAHRRRIRHAGTGRSRARRRRSRTPS